MLAQKITQHPHDTGQPNKKSLVLFPRMCAANKRGIDREKGRVAMASPATVVHYPKCDLKPRPQAPQLSPFVVQKRVTEDNCVKVEAPIKRGQGQYRNAST